MLIKGDRRSPSRVGPLLVGGLSAALLIGLGAVGADLSQPANRELLWSMLRPDVAAPAPVSPDVEKLVLRIKWDDLARLERKRETALRQGVLVTGPDDFVPAHLIAQTADAQTADAQAPVGGFEDAAPDANAPWMKVKVRLKGDWSEHVKGRHWSMRVKLAGEERLFGMKTFSLQHPRHRNGLHGWLYHQILRREGIVALRYRFVHLFLNQEDLGIYAVEEHFDHRLLEDNGFREGPILRFDEDLRWAMIADPDLAPPTRELSEISDIRPYSAARIASDHVQRAAFVRAASLLESLRGDNTQRAVEEVFDVPKMARFYALADLVGGHHGIGWGNQRLYLNPLTGRLEPIGFDANAGTPLDQTALEAREGLAPLWRNPGFRRAYLGELERLARRDYLETLLVELGDELGRQHAILSRMQAAGDHPMALEPLERLRAAYAANQQKMRRIVQPLRALRVHRGDADAVRTSGELELEVINLSEVPIEVMALARTASATTLALAVPQEIAPWRAGPVRVDRVRFAVPADQRASWRNLEGAELRFRIAGTQATLTESILPWPAPRAELVPPDLLGNAFQVPERDFLVLPESPPEADEASDREIRIRPGTWTVDRDLVIPAGYRLVAGAGVTLDLRAGASLLSYSPIDFRGQPERPIVIHSSDRSGQGLMVVDAREPSRLDHVQFADLSAPRGRGWAMTGAVTFYQSPVTIHGGIFQRNHASDDALNVVRAELELKNSRFHATESDAIDIDFGSGEIRACHFERIEGDAVDISGSRITLGQSKFLGVGDKAVSVGEMSHLLFRDLEIEGARMGLVSKDASTVEGSGLELRGGEIGFLAFRKKPEYGAATLRVFSYRANDVAELYRLEPGSELMLDSESMAVNAADLRQQLYPDGAS